MLPENVDPNDPELQKQIDAILKELDPDFLLVGSRKRSERVVIRPTTCTHAQIAIDREYKHFFWAARNCSVHEQCG